ncbi:MAG: HupE/UreJ family protein [Betaproteobacteria bacterium]|jgi:HupE / UreJ protein|nr:HupE/UreJ family protein [Betaproteobacteria bacterium]NBZ99221.1 HupE/UreJ family protein [Betaproteobacteria bacterium]NDD02564.1 HupE/UreJ family protein [Betaproteobacteria bacterium]NDE25476.1 HupE/UreJ family protein [Betaproteobacteria bacterium]
MNATLRSVVRQLAKFSNLKAALALTLLGFLSTAQAHSSSNSFLSLRMDAERLILRADVSMRDVDMVFNLDQDRNGQVTWAETQVKEKEITQWLQQGIQLQTSGQTCALETADLQASEHADGIYLSAQWQVVCPIRITLENLPSTSLGMRYNLIFAQDNLHRGLLNVDLPELQSSHMFSPDRPEAVITSTQNSVLQVFLHYLLEGVWHIWIGIDHILFLLSLLVLAPLQAGRSRVTQWPAVPRARTAVMEVLAVVTAFTLAHSITLGASVLKWLEPSPNIIEPAIAITVVLVALNNLLGWSAVKRWPLAFAFGLIHGFGFANVLLDLGLPTRSLAAALGGFNVGVELGQLAIVGVFLPMAWLLRHTAFYRWGIVFMGSITIAILGTLWVLERTGLM